MSAVGLESIHRTVRLTQGGSMISTRGLTNTVPIACCEPCCRRCVIGFRSTTGWSLAHSSPTLLRGVYFEHWRPAATPVKQRSKAGFIARIADAFQNDPTLLANYRSALTFICKRCCSRSSITPSPRR
jgi:hypothetical protein